MNANKRKVRLDSTGFRQTSMALGPFGPLWEHYSLVWVLAWSELKSTYSRSVFGLFWLVMLPVFYVTVFVAVRILLFDRSATSPDWEGSALGVGDVPMLALQIFIGFLVFWEASEILNRAPSAIRSNANLIQGSVFPVEMLPWITIISALFNMLVRLVIFLVAYVAVVHGFQATTWMFPIVVAPLVLMMIGIAYLFATIGTYFHDLDYILAGMTTGLLLLSAVIFPLSEVPEAYKPFVIYNPIAMAIEQARLVVILGRMPDWQYLGWAALSGIGLSWFGFAVFRRFRSGFADVL
jgi:lipopolysaccharide transport system permease protein